MRPAWCTLKAIGALCAAVAIFAALCGASSVTWEGSLLYRLGCQRIGEAAMPGPAWDLGFDDPDGPSWPVSQGTNEAEGPSSPLPVDTDCARVWLEQPVAPGQAAADVRATTALHSVACGSRSELPTHHVGASDWTTWIDTERRFGVTTLRQSIVPRGTRACGRARRSEDARLGTECTLGDGRRHILAATFTGQVEGMYFGRGEAGLGYYPIPDVAPAYDYGGVRVLLLHSALDLHDEPSSGPHAVGGATGARQRPSRRLRLPNGRRREGHARQSRNMTAQGRRQLVGPIAPFTDIGRWPMVA